MKSSWSPAATDGLELGCAAAGFGAVEGPAGVSLGFPAPAAGAAVLSALLLDGTFEA